MRVCLIYPPTDNMIRTNVPPVVDDVSGAYPPLGLLYVAAAIEKSGNHEVSVIDCVAEKLNEDDTKQRIIELNPDLVGIQAITFSIVDAYNIAKLVKNINQDIKVLFGGPHANLFPKETLALQEIDYILLGEAENSIADLLDKIEKNENILTIPGTVKINDNGEIEYGPNNDFINDLDAIPTPARHLINNRLYSSVLGSGKLMTTIMSSRGCPAQCIFCDRPHLGKKFRFRSAENIIKEIEDCVNQFGIDEFIFYDDTFTINKKRVFKFCELLLKNNLNIKWDIRARISTVDYDMLKALKNAGCSRIHFGIESGSKKILKTIRKGVDLDKAQKIFKWCKSLGIETLAYFMFGFPGEGLFEIEETINYALSIDCDYVHVAATTPFPGTELYQMGLENRIYQSDYWSEFASDPTNDFVPEIWVEELTREEIIASMNELYKRFYRRPSYIAKRIMKVKSPQQFVKYAKAGIKILQIG